MIDMEGSGGGTAEGGEAGAAAKELTEVVSKGADVRSFRAVHVDVDVRIFEMGNVKLVNLAGAGLAFDFDTFAG